jgi:LPS-assembly lipoprotein
MFIDSEGGALNAALLQRLQYSGVRLAPRPQDARVVIRILGDSRGSRVAAVDRGGKAVARELHYRVTFDVTGGDGKERIPAQTIDLVRTYENPDFEVLGKQLEEDLIYEDLVQDAAERILGRLRAVLL